MSAPNNAAGWYLDPSGRHEWRYYRGDAWTEHVSDQGRPGLDPVGVAPPRGAMTFAARDDSGSGVASAPPEEPRDSKPPTGVEVWKGSGFILDEPVLIFNRTGEEVDGDFLYPIQDPSGRVLGDLRALGVSDARRIVEVVSQAEQYVSRYYEIRDGSGSVLMRLKKPVRVFLSKVVLATPEGQDFGQVTQRDDRDVEAYLLESAGYEFGGIQLRSRQPWDFRIHDGGENEIGSITAEPPAVFGVATVSEERYFVHLYKRLEEPLRSLAIAAALAIDVVLGRNEKGLE